MKLKELAIDGIGNRRDLRLEGFGDGLTLVYGENGAGKTTVREFIRGTLFDINHDLPINARYTAGRLKVTNGADEFQLSRDVHLNSEVDIRALTDFNGNGYSGRDKSLRQLVERLNVDLYDSVFSVSFRETPTNASRLASVLQNQLSVPSGPEAAGDDSAYLSWQRDTNERQQQADSLRLRIELLTAERNQCLNQIESFKSGRQEQVNDVEQRLGQIRARIIELQSSSNQDRLQCTDREIAKLRTWIDSQQNHDPYVAPEVDSTAQYPAICQRLDDVDDQIRRWRHVQTEIQNQRVRVRDEMLVWNELTLDSEEHPYHYARAILVSLESKVDEAERNANHWGDAAAARVDTAPMARMLGQLCHGMRDELYGLCNELSQQYKHIRHKAAAAELKQLRRSYGEMGENIQHLIQRRDALVREVRKLDPAGAEAIVRADVKFCECARQFGYFEARKRFVGPDVLSLAKSTVQVNIPNLHSEHARLALLLQQRRELNALMSGGGIELNELLTQQSELIRQRDVLLGESNLHDLNLKLQDIDGRLQLLNSEQSVAQRQLELNRDFLPIQPNPLIHAACGLLSRMSGGDLTQVFLSEPITSVAGEKQIGLQVRDQYGKVLNFSAIDPGLQDQVYLCLMLAAKEQLKQQFIQAPTVIDDAFCRITAEHITATLNELDEFTAQGHQIIALTQHRYLADRIPGVPLLELPPTMPTLDPVITPDRHPVVTPVITPIPVPDWNPESFVTTEVYATSSLPRPYPLSKYPHSHSRHSVQDYGYTVSYPFPVFGQQQESNRQSNPVDVRTSPPAVHPVSANEIGDRLGYMSSIDESTRLDKVGFFDPTQLRMFQANGIVSVADLMAIEPDHARTLGPHAEQIDRWQSQLWLLMTLPGLRVNDARVLVSCGVTDPEHLDTSHPQQILERIERFFSTSEGKRFAGNNESMTIERVNGWYRSLDATRSRWSNRGSDSHRQPNSSEQPSGDRQEFQPETISADRSTFDGTARAYQPRKRNDRDRAPRPTRAPIHARPPRMNTPVPERKVVPRVAPASKLVADKVAQRTEAKTPIVVANRKLKFYLDLNDHVEAAPSIGPKTAERFEKIGIATVTDFLKQTAESMETKLNYKRISAKLIRDWQHQARLICRVPNLRGHDAQLLVACGITEPEELSTMQPQNLFDIIGPFSETKEGLKIIRNGKKPDLAEVTNWIAWAEQTRSLQAA